MCAALRLLLASLRSEADVSVLHHLQSLLPSRSAVILPAIWRCLAATLHFKPLHLQMKNPQDVVNAALEDLTLYNDEQFQPILMALANITCKCRVLA